jgi:hypothetical protein
LSIKSCFRIDKHGGSNMEKKGKTNHKNNLGKKAIVLYLTMILLTGVYISIPSVQSNPLDPWWNQEWIVRKEITIDHTKILSDLVNFPVLISITFDSNLALHAQDDGDDLVFTTIDMIKLNHEIEMFSGATGQLVAWVNVTSLSSTVDTVLYMYYGNPSCSNQQNVPGTWNGGYGGVWHMNDITTTTVKDSTINHNNGTKTSANNPVETLGRIGQSQYFSGSNRILVGTGNSLAGEVYTIECWIKPDISQPATSTNYFISRALGSYNYKCRIMGDTGRTSFEVYDATIPSYKQSQGTVDRRGYWNYFAAIRDTSGDISQYLNITKSTVVDATGLTLTKLNANTFIGSGANYSQFYKGIIDELRFSKVERSDAWLKTCYNNQYNPSVFYSVGNEEITSINRPPIINQENPQNNSQTVSIHQTRLNVTIEDPDGDLFNWTIEGKYVITNGSHGDINGTKSAVLIAPLPFDTEIIWYVNTTDYIGSGNWTKKTYKFTTTKGIPSISLNFAGNPSDNGGPYYLPGTSTPAPEGYYTNASYQQEKWLYINSTAIDDIGIEKVWLHWLNGTQWANNTYQLIHTTGNFYEINMSAGIGPGSKYSFDLLAVNTYGNTALYRWLKVGSDTTAVDDRRYVQLAGTPTNVSYTPYYFYSAQYKYTSGYGPGHNITNDDILHHDQGPDGTLTDSGYLLSSIPTSTIEKRNCTMYIGYWFDETITAQSGFIRNIYHHLWWHNDNNTLTVAYGKSDSGFYRTEAWGQSYPTNSTKAHSSILSNNKNYYLESNLMQITSPQPFTDNDIYEFFVEYYTPSITNPFIINNRSILSFVIFNVPNNTTLQTMDTDNDGLTDYQELYITFTNPFIKDTDNDGVSDYIEHMLGSDPNDYTDTAEIVVPILITEIPTNGTIGQLLNPKLSITVDHPLNKTMNLTFRTNATGTWFTIGYNYSIPSGTYSTIPTAMNQNNAKYWWTVNCSDGIFWTNKTFYFTTKQPSSSWWNQEWSYRKEITIDHTKILSNLVNFPVLINLNSDNILALHTQGDGDDLVFTTKNGVKMNHEIEMFNSTSGQLVAWVNVTNLSSTIDTVLYMYYGNPVCTNQQNVPGTWNGSYGGVWHMNDKTTTTIKDSTINHNNGTKTSANNPLESLGRIGKSQYFGGTNRILVGSGNSLASEVYTIECWLKPDVSQPSTNTNYFLSRASGSYNYKCRIFGDTGYSDFEVYDSIIPSYKRSTFNTNRRGHWTYFVALRDTSGDISQYLNTTKSTVVDATGLSLKKLNTNTFVGSGTTSSQYYKGVIDELRFSKVERSDAWLKTCYNNQYNPSGFFTVGSEESTSPINRPPVVNLENPQNNSQTVSIHQARVNVTIEDPDGDLFNWTIQGKYVMPAGSTGATGGTKSALLRTPLPFNTTIVWFVNATDHSGSGNWTRRTYKFTTSPRILPTVKYQIMYTPVGWSFVGPLVADINGDGKQEIVRTGVTGIAAFDGETGIELWHRTDYKMDPNGHSMFEIIDLNKDGILEIIYGSGGSTIALHGNDGSTYWINTNAPLWDKYPVTGDINADGFPEVFVTIPGKLTGLTHDGQIFAQTSSNTYPCFGGLSLGDTDHDGRFELYQGNRPDMGLVSYWASNLTTRWKVPFQCSSQCPSLVDVNKDGILDVVMLQQSGDGIYVVWSKNGTIMQKQDSIPGMSCHTMPPIYDIDNDGDLELIAVDGAQTPLNPIVFNLNVTKVGTSYPNWKIDKVLPYKCSEPPSIADIDGDGNVEIIETCKNNVTFYDNKYNIIGILPIASGQAFVIAQDLDNDGLTELTFNVGYKSANLSSICVLDTVASAPTPRALSQFIFYSPHRGRVPYYAPYGPPKPIIKYEMPTNKSSNQTRNPSLSIYVYDYQYDLMKVTFRTNASTGIWHDITMLVNVSYGNYSIIPTDMNFLNTKYWWSINCTDGQKHWTNKTFSFKTIAQDTLQWWNYNWLNRKVIKIDHTKVLSNLVNFPILININTDDKLAAHAQPDGDDIVFTTNAGTKLNHEIERFNHTSGQLVAWVNVTSLSSTVDTVLYMYYGNPSCSNQQNVPGTWNGGYGGVWHMNDITTTTIKDSTINHNNGTKTSANNPVETLGRIGQSQYFGGTNRILVGSDNSLSGEVYTIECWIKPDISQPSTNTNYFLSRASGSYNYKCRIFGDTGYSDFEVYDSIIPSYKRSTLNTNRRGYWNYFAAIRDTSGDISQYLNITKSTVVDATGLTLAKLNTNTFVGSGTTSSQYYKGMIDELRFSKVQRSDAWLKTCYNNQYNPTGFYTLYYEEALSHAPTLSNEQPTNGTIDLPVNSLQLNAQVQDIQNDPVTWRISSNATGGWSIIANGVLSNGYGTITATPTTMNNYETTYYWRITATDGISWTNQTYHFTTITGKPRISNVIPAKNSTKINLDPMLQATIADAKDLGVNWWIASNATGSWSILANGLLTTGNGFINATPTAMNHYETTYYWRITATDGTYWTNETYKFTTRSFITSYWEDFESFTTGQRVGMNPSWYDGGTGPMVSAGVGVAGSIGLQSAGSIFTWNAHPFNWNVNNLVGVNLQMDFKTNSAGQFDDDCIGWMITNTSTDSSNLFGFQLDQTNVSIETKWCNSVGDRIQMPLAPLLGIKANTWYRFRTNITKLAATSAQIDVLLTELDISGNPLSVVTYGSIENTSAWGEDSPNTVYFTGTKIWPAFKNRNANTDNACFEIITSGPIKYTLTVNEFGNGSVIRTPDKTLYNYGENVTLTAIADADWKFNEWHGNLLGNTNPDTITITGNITINATFIEWPRFAFVVISNPRPIDHYDGFKNDLTQISQWYHLPTPDMPSPTFMVINGDFDHTNDTDHAIRISVTLNQSFAWFPIIGNHEFDNGNLYDLKVVKNTFFPTLPGIVNSGPAGSKNTTYSWQYKNAFFVSANCYWNGTTGENADHATDGDIPSPLRNWVNDAVTSSGKIHKFVFVHEPAYPMKNYIGESLDKYPTNRDAFVTMLNSSGVETLFVSHDEYYHHNTSGTHPLLGNVHQVCSGKIQGQGTGGDNSTIIYVLVNGTNTTYKVYRSSTGVPFDLYEEWTIALNTQ